MCSSSSFIFDKLSVSTGFSKTQWYEITEKWATKLNITFPIGPLNFILLSQIAVFFPLKKNTFPFTR